MQQRYIVMNEDPGQNWDVGQVVGVGRGDDKLLAQKAIKQLPHGMPLCVCDACGSEFLHTEALTAHQAKRHPQPAKKAKQDPSPQVEAIPSAVTSPAPAEPLPKEEDHEENP